MKRLSENWYWIIVAGFICFAAAVFLINGTNSIISIHDNLDLFMPQYQMMKDGHTFFAHNVQVPILGGISRDCLPSEINLYTVLFMLLPGYYAYIAGYLLKIVIAIAGTFLLASQILGGSYDKYHKLVILTGFAYGILNFFPNFGFCFASIPLFCYIMCKIATASKKVILWYVLLFLYPVVSYFSYFGLFLIGYLVLYFIGSSIKNKTFKVRIFIAVIVLSLGYFACEYRLFMEMLFSETDSIRKSMVIGNLDFKGILLTVWEGIAKGDMHSEALQYIFVMPVCLAFFVYQAFVYIKRREAKKILSDPIFYILLFIVFNSIIYALYYCGPFRNLFDKCLPPLAGFQFTRTVYFNPFLWYLFLFIAAGRLLDKGKKILPYLIVLISIFITVLSGTRYNDLFHTCLSDYHRLRSGEMTNELSFKEFYSEKLFDEALADIGYSGEWSAAYGLYPAVLEYNGIKTLDGYLGYYSEEYKGKFRKIIAPALERVPESKAYFDNWGARCSVYSGTYPTNVIAGRNNIIESEELFIDTESFKALDGKYIFSGIEITNAKDIGFELAGIYNSEESVYTLYVYKTV